METSRSGGARGGAWTYLSRYRRRILLGVALLLTNSAVALTIPWLLGQAIEALRGPAPARRTAVLAMAMIGLAAAQGLTRIGARVVLLDAAVKATANLRSTLFRHLLSLDAAFYRKHPVGDIMSRLTSDVQTVGTMLGMSVPALVQTALLLLFALILMVGIDPMLTLWGLLPYPIVVVLGGVYGRLIYRSSLAVQKETGRLSASLQEDLGGIAIIKAYTLEPDRERRFGVRSAELLGKNMALTRVRGQLMPMLGAVASLSTVAMLLFGGRAVIQQRISLGQLIQMNAYLALLVQPTLGLGYLISLYKRGQASWARLAELLGTPPAIADGAVALDDVRGHVSLRGLTIEIDGRRLVDDVSLDMRPGTVTAIVGRLGSGKSLLLEAIPRTVDVSAGQVFLDGHDVTRLRLADLRGAIGYAPQEAFLFSTTIAENIAMGVKSGEAFPAEELLARVREAAAAAGLERDLAALPEGLDTIVGERGVILSGGQRQRVALARALASEPRVLILDDSLSSVDTETEREILARLDEIMRGRTAILVSHRVAAIRRAHQIAVLDGGRLVEIGTHDQLIALGGLYAELYRVQLEEELAA